MAKFKVGDRVKVASVEDFKGMVGTIVGNEEGDAGERVRVSIDSRCLEFWFTPDELEADSSPLPYRDAVIGLIDRQEAKGRAKYGISLEENVTLTIEQRIEHLEEELIDALMYCEHLKVGQRENGLTANDYQRAALRTAQTDKFGLTDLILNGVMGLNGEAGEVIDLVKKVRYQGHDLDREKMLKELGDCAWYIALTAHAFGFTLEEVFQGNIDKLKERYPEGFDKARSVHRQEESD